MDGRLSRRDALTLLGGAALAGASPSRASAQAAPPARRPIGIVSRHLQWTDLEGAIAVAKEAGFDAIEWNVRKGGHVAPERVEQELPRAVDLTRKAGLAATMITTAIQDAQSPFAEPILRAAQAAGIRWYRGGEYFRYDYAKPLLPQLEALKPRIASLVDLNRKYGTTWAYHTHSAPGMIGGGVWDIWGVIKDFDPASIGLNFDIGHATARNGVGWVDAATVVAALHRRTGGEGLPLGARPARLAGRVLPDRRRHDRPEAAGGRARPQRLQRPDQHPLRAQRTARHRRRHVDAADHP